jgi:hypothetical protein
MKGAVMLFSLRSRAERMQPLAVVVALSALLSPLTSSYAQGSGGTPSLASQRHACVRALILTVQNERLDPDVRRGAVYALGAMRDKEALHFLMDNIDLFIPVEVVLGDRDMMRWTPRYEVLYSLGDPGIVPLIFSALDKPRTEGEISRYGCILIGMRRSRILANEAIDELIKQQMGTMAKPVRKENLKRLRNYLSD